MPDMAITGSQNSDNPEIIINGIAKPIAPFTNPATSVTAIAANNAHSGINENASKNTSIAHTTHLEFDYSLS